MTRLFLFILVIAATLPGVSYGEKSDKAVDYQKMADEARWLPPDEKGLLRCLAGQLSDYQVEVIRKKGNGWRATIRVKDGEEEVYSWKAHLDTVFLDRDGILYYADFDPISTVARSSHMT